MDERNCTRFFVVCLNTSAASGTIQAARSAIFAFDTPSLSVDFNACSASVRCGDGTSAGLFLLVPEQGLMMGFVRL
jgi:hypothetical protein